MKKIYKTYLFPPLAYKCDQLYEGFPNGELSLYFCEKALLEHSGFFPIYFCVGFDNVLYRTSHLSYKVLYHGYTICIK